MIDKDKLLDGVRRMAGTFLEIHQTGKYKSYIGKDKRAFHVGVVLFVLLILLAGNSNSILCGLLGVVVGLVLGISQMFFNRGYLWPMWTRYMDWTAIKRLADGDEDEIAAMKKHIEEVLD